MPCRRTVSMRAFIISGGPKYGAVLQSTSRAMRSGAWAPSHMPTVPPIDSPQKRARSMPCASSIRSTSAPSWAIVYGPAGTDDSPWPRVSYRSTRKRRANASTWGYHMPSVAPSECDSTSTGPPCGPSHGMQRAPPGRR